MATAVMSHHFVAQPSAHYGYVAPPSPPMDEASRCSLPSISNLLGLADAGSPTSDHFPSSQQQQSVAGKSDTRPNSSHFVSGTARTTLPPTPPMSSDASFDGYGSPSTRSISHVSVTSNSHYTLESATPPLGQVEADFQRHQPQQQQQPMATAPPHSSAPRIASTFQAPFVTSSFISQPSLNGFFPPTMQQPAQPPQPQISGLFFQRPLPQAFPPPMPMSLGGGPNPWQHHHYISPSTAASFPQSQDRYICQTCNKAFSRPSSLRIHSHSHTGEKPFKCAHPGCGKAFSVRSNMKRHERGCHSFESGGSSGSALLV